MIKLLEKLHNIGVKLKLEDSLDLRIIGKKEKLTPEIIKEIKENKENIVKWLQEEGNRAAVSAIKANKLTGLCAPSFAQQRLWFIDKLQNGTPEYNMPIVFEVKGALELSLVRDVFTQIITRHEVIRTVYLESQGEAKQCIRPMSEVDFRIEEIDLSDLIAGALSAAVNSYVEKDSLKPFNLAQDLMLRVSYVHTSDETGVLVFNMHHIASDGWSMELLTKEFFELYEAFYQGKPSPLSELDIQYADYAHWQRTHLKGDVLDSQLDYWEKQLNEAPQLHSLPLSYPRPDVKAHLGAIVSGSLPASVAKNLQALANEYQLTPFMLLHGALSLVLSRHSNSSDVMIGTPVANRLQAELEPLIGFFVNTLILRVDTSYDTLSDYFYHIKKVNLDAQSNQDIPFEQLVERLNVERSTAHSPLFQIMMTTNTNYGLNNESDIESFTLPGVEIRKYDSDFNQSKFDLNIDLRINEQGVGLYWNYDVSLFTEQYIMQLNDHLCRLLEGLSQSLGQPTLGLHKLPILSSNEIEQLVFDLNDTAMHYSKDKCIHELFEQQASENPDNVALVFENKQLTYKQLNEKANQLAHYLKTQYGVEPNTLIGLCVERSFEMVIGILGILKAGAAYVPFDIEHGTEILNARMNSHIVPIAIFSDNTQGLVENECIEQLNINELLLQPSSNHTRENLSTTCSSESIAFAMSSSGTTGKPKLIGMSHKALNNLIESFINDNEVFKGSHRVLQFASVGFDMSFSEIALALLQGGSLYLITESMRFDVAVLTDLINRNEISLLNLPSSMVKVLSEICVDHQIKFTSLRAIISSAEKLENSLKLKEFFDLNKNIKLVNHYGPTETNVCTTYNLQGSPKDWPIEIPIGKPICNTQCFVLDSKKSLVPTGVIGELYVGGDCLSVGYLGNEDLTNEKFIQIELPNIGITRLYRTGDLVKWEHGQLIYSGRIDDQIKINGYRIELNDVIQQIKMHPSVLNATVINDSKLNHLIGYYSGDVIDDAELRSYLSETMPSYMVPKHFVKVDEFNLNINGKIDKHSLPALNESYLTNEYIAPSTSAEIKLADIWSDVLDIPQEQISVNSNFFELGGTSIMLIKVLHLIQSRFEINILVNKLYQLQNLSSLSHFLVEESALKNIVEMESEESQWEI